MELLRPQKCPLEALTWENCCNLLKVLSLGLLGRSLWNQYWVFRHGNLPPVDLGLPILGHTLQIFKFSLEEWGYRLMKGSAVKVTNFLFTTCTMVSYPVYLKHIHRAELDGELVPAWIPSMKALVGDHSVIALPGGKGHGLHKRLRAKILSSMGPKPSLAFLPQILGLVRATLDGLAEETAKNGFAVFEPAASSLASKVSSMMITAGLSDELQTRCEEMMDRVIAGIVAVPLNLGSLTTYGRAMQGRRELFAIVKKLMESPNEDRRNIVQDLARASEDGEALSLEEMVDTVITLLVAGKFTTSDALPALLVDLAQHRNWAEKVASEPLAFSGIEEDSATLRVVRESMRKSPAVGAYRRSCATALDLGEHGRIPAGCPMAVVINGYLRDNGGTEFDPDRWTPENARDFLAFGGSQPHSCVGRYLALLELQAFARVLCKEYEFEALDTSLVVAGVVRRTFKDGLKVTIKKK